MTAHQNKNNQETVEYWIKELDAAKEKHVKFHERCDKIWDKYMLESEASADAVTSFGYNILYSNTETLIPALFSNSPKPDVRAKRSTNKLAYKNASTILEANILNVMDAQDIHGIIEDVIEDYALPGYGIMRICYEPYTGEEKEEGELVYETIEWEHTPIKRFLCSDEPKWEDKRWIAFKGEMTKDEVVEMASKAIAESLSYEAPEMDDKRENRKAHEWETNVEVTPVWEIWDKQTRERIFIAEGYSDSPLQIDKDPYKLSGFFPAPEPLRAVKTTKSWLPKPFYSMYQDQAEELDEVTERITLITREIKRRGVYDAGYPDLEKVVNGGDNTFIPIQNFAKFVEKGGINGAVAEMPLGQLIDVRTSLYQQRAEILSIIYQIQGLADIMRGASDPNETAKAQKLKSHYGMMRINKQQRRVQKFIRQAVEMTGELIAENFSAEAIAMAADVEKKIIKTDQGSFELTPVQVVEQLMPLLRNQEPRSIAIDIETDSTIAADADAEQEQALRFTQVLESFAQTSPILVQAFGMEVATEMLKALTSKFKLSRQLQSALDKQMEEITKQAEEAKNQPKQEKPSIDEQKLAMDGQKLQMQMQSDAAKIQIDVAKLQQEERKIALREKELGIKESQGQQKLDLDGSIAWADHQFKQAALVVESANKRDNAVVGA